MKKEYPASSLILAFVLCFTVYSQDYKQDSLAVRAILDSNNLDTVAVTSVSRVGNNRIDTLIIASKKLSTLPAVIGTLTRLKYLDLHDNSLKTIPAEIGSLTELLYMGMHQNAIKTIPATIGNLTALNRLELRDNQISVIPAQIQSLVNLERLYLSSNSLTSVPAEIGQLSNLKGLYLESNQITSLPAQIGNLTKLTILWVHMNKLSALPKETGSISTLQILFLGNNTITEIPSEIGKLSALNSLTLNNNRLATLPDSIALLKTSTGGLDLGYNNLDTTILSKTILTWADQYDPDWRGTQTIGIKNRMVLQISNTFSITSYPKTIQITYTLPNACRIKIDLYDTHGKLLHTVSHEHQSKGPHSATIATNRFGSNMHYIRFSADGFGAFSRAVARE